MKDADRKARIRALFAAESLGKERDDKVAAAWQKFKTQAVSETLPAETPALEINRKRSSPARPRVWVAAAALIIAVGAVYLFSARLRKETIEPGTAALIQQVAQRQKLERGAVFRHERRQIAVLSGTADLTLSHEGKFDIEATALQARFSLKQPTALVLHHKLVTLTVTGTEFIFSADAHGGSVRLSEGRLRIRYRSDAQETLLIAPAVYHFTEKNGSVQQAPTPAGEKKLWRYDLVSGETFFAWQVHVTQKKHEVKLLGGKKRIIMATEILRAELADPE